MCYSSTDLFRIATTDGALFYQFQHIELLLTIGLVSVFAFLTAQMDSVMGYQTKVPSSILGTDRVVNKIMTFRVSVNILPFPKLHYTNNLHVLTPHLPNSCHFIYPSFILFRPNVFKSYSWLEVGGGALTTVSGISNVR